MDTTKEKKYSEWTTHLMEHIERWPASKEEIVAACNNMEDVPAEDKKWVMDNLPEGMYKDSQEVENVMNQVMTQKEEAEEKTDEDSSTGWM